MSITAMKQALEAMDTVMFDAGWYQAKEDLRQAIAEIEKQEPEPVGYLYVTDPWGAPEYHFSVEKKEGYFNEPVYKHPPKRKPLTDEQIFACENNVPDAVVSDRDWCIYFARAIEAAHGIKGEA